MVERARYRRPYLRGWRFERVAVATREHAAALLIVVVLEESKATETLDRGLAPLGTVTVPLGWAVVAAVVAVAGIAFVVRRRSRVGEAELDTAHAVVVHMAYVEASRQPSPGNIDSVLEAARHGLEEARGDWVHCALDQYHPHPPGVSVSGSSWNCRVGPDGRSLTFTTGDRFSPSDVLALKRIGELIELLLFQASAEEGTTDQASDQQRPLQN